LIKKIKRIELKRPERNRITVLVDDTRRKKVPEGELYSILPIPRKSEQRCPDQRDNRV